MSFFVLVELILRLFATLSRSSKTSLRVFGCKEIIFVFGPKCSFVMFSTCEKLTAQTSQ